ATFGLLESEADLAIVVGGYNSSNTMHIVELLERKFPTYHIRDASELISRHEARHFNQWDKQVRNTLNWYPGDKKTVTVAITSGASCPDTLVDEVITRIAGYHPDARSIDDALAPFAE